MQNPVEGRAPHAEKGGHVLDAPTTGDELEHMLDLERRQLRLSSELHPAPLRGLDPGAGALGDERALELGSTPIICHMARPVAVSGDTVDNHQPMDLAASIGALASTNHQCGMILYAQGVIGKCDFRFDAGFIKKRFQIIRVVVRSFYNQ